MRFKIVIFTIGLFLLLSCEFTEKNNIITQNKRFNSKCYTSLQGGYYVQCREEYSKEGKHLDVLLLIKEDKIISKIGEQSHGLPSQNLGYVSVDCENIFILFYGFGGGNPRVLQIIEKMTGNVFDMGELIIINESKGNLIYTSNRKNNKKVIKDISGCFVIN